MKIFAGVFLEREKGQLASSPRYAAVGSPSGPGIPRGSMPGAKNISFMLTQFACEIFFVGTPLLGSSSPFLGSDSGPARISCGPPRFASAISTSELVAAALGLRAPRPLRGLGGPVLFLTVKQKRHPEGGFLF